jgi:dTDP-3-amino-3,4,6-trideoxy-alpha-D-glucose transaminase
VHAPIRREIDEAIARTVDSGWFLRGPEAEAFEREWAARCGQRFAVACNSGTDALTLAALALDLPSASVPAITLPLTAIGLDHARVPVAVREVTADGHLAVVPLDAVPVLVHGRLPSEAELRARLFDAAHAHGWRPPEGSTSAWSFYPTKTLGALGDAGAVTTDDPAVAERLRALRGSDDQLHDARQITSRMDEVQAAVLRVKLAHLDEYLDQRAAIAARYDEAFVPLGLTIPGPSLHHLYALAVPDRGALVNHLHANGIGAKAHWARSLDLLRGPWQTPDPSYEQAQRWSARTVSLPCYPGLRDDEVDRVVDAVTSWCCGR